MESVFEKSVGGYLAKLEIEYDVIEKIKPVGSKKLGKNQKYRIKDNFLQFWFRYIYKNIALIESERFELVRKLIQKDIRTYRGPYLERLFIELKKMNPDYGIIGTYWEKQNLNEIDIVAINELDKQIDLSEVKRNKDKVNLQKLKEKAVNLEKRYGDYRFTYEALGLEDIERWL